MYKRIQILFIVGFFIPVSLPLIQTVRPFLPSPALNGVFDKEARPRISIYNWLSASFQGDFDKWLDSHLGLRSYLIKSDNQLNFSLFKEISQKTNTPIVVGLNNNLYEKVYVDSYQATTTIQFSLLEDKVKKIKQLQDALVAKGKRFVVLISPSKATIYPEYLPINIKKNKVDKLTNYDIYRGLLNKYQINYFDSHAYLLDLKKTSPYKLFAKGATHWNYYSACLASSQLFNKLDNAENKWPILSCDNIKIENQSRKEDRDLADLINIWQDKVFYEPLAYPRPRISNDSSYRPRLLIIGGSFIWNILRILKESHAMKESDFYYYFSENSKYPTNTFLPINKENSDINKDIEDRDAVILESNEAGLTNIGFGFIEKTLAEIK